MPSCKLLVLSLWIYVVRRGLCDELVKISQQPANTLGDYGAYRHISIVHFNVPENSVSATFRFVAKEAKTGGIGKCTARSVSLFLKSGSLPFVNPDGSRIAAKLMKERRRYYSEEMESNGGQRVIKIDAPSPGDWYAIAFRSWSDPDSGKITQQGLRASCDTELDAELLVEQPRVTSLIVANSRYENQLNRSSDSAVLQFHVPEGFDDWNVLLDSSCTGDCKMAVHVTGEDNLASAVVNNTEATIPFKPYANTFHYITLRMLSNGSSNFSVQVIPNLPIISSQLKTVDLTRKTMPEFFLFDYEHIVGNSTKPSAFNLTADNLSVLSFKVGPVYDVGGTVSLGVKLVDVEEKDKRKIFVVACISLGYYANVTAGGSCRRAENITAADIYANATGPAFVHVPFPEPGTWYMTLRALCAEEKCHCADTCLNGTACETCECINFCSTKIETSIASSPCVEGSCGAEGKCMHYMSGGFVFAACHCFGGYRGFDCADDAYVLGNGGIIIRLLLLTFSNLGFVGSVYVAIRREYFTEAIVYAAVMFFSTFYHACEAGEDVYSICIMRLSVLQFCDFYNALLSIWVTLVAMASFGPRLTAFCQIAGAVILAMSAEMDRTALWVFLLPAMTGCSLIGLSWGGRCRRRKSVRYPARPYRLIYFPAGILIVSLGLVCYAFLQTRRNYHIIHSFWHVCVAVGVILLLPKRQYMK